MKIKLLLLSLFLSLSCFSQITFDSGYFIDNWNQKVECFIKNIDWKNNPTEFEYKIAKNDNPIVATIAEVQEFEVYNFSKYVRAKVKIDRSSEILSELTRFKEPKFVEETLFLRVLIEGKANLYAYDDASLRRYFFSTNEQPIEQLVYKSFLKEGYYMNKNFQFRQQLFTLLKCEVINLPMIEKIEYRKEALIDFFKIYNSCSGVEAKDYDQKPKQDLINLNIRPRIQNIGLSIQNASITGNEIIFDKKTSFSLGIEFEMILPINKNKWAIAIEPTFQTYSSDRKINNPNSFLNAYNIQIKYSSIDLPLSIRHYMYLNNNSKFFVNLSLSKDFLFNSEINFISTTGVQSVIFNATELKSSLNTAFGVGYKFKDKFIAELRLHSKRQILINNGSWESNLSSTSLIFGYTLF